MKTLVSGACIRQNSRLTPATMACGSGVAAACTRISPTRHGVHMPAASPFPADVAERQNQTAARLLDGKEITRQVADGKDLTRNLEVTAPHQAGGAEASVHLRSLEECGVKIAILFLECRELRHQLPGASGGMHCPVAERVAEIGTSRTPRESWLTHRT